MITRTEILALATVYEATHTQEEFVRRAKVTIPTQSRNVLQALWFAFDIAHDLWVR